MLFEVKIILDFFPLSLSHQPTPPPPYNPPLPIHPPSSLHPSAPTFTPTLPHSLPVPSPVSLQQPSPPSRYPLPLHQHLPPSTLSGQRRVPHAGMDYPSLHTSSLSHPLLTPPPPPLTHL